MKYIILIGILILLIGCTETSEIGEVYVGEDGTNINQEAADNIKVLEYCDEGMICYWVSVCPGFLCGSGMSCFRDADLIEKYC